jgi:hypothetical protein
VRLLTRLAAGPLRDTHPPEHRERMSQEAVDMARRLGHPATLAYALEGRYDANWGPAVLENRLAIANELIDVAEAANDPERAYAGRDSRFIALLESGDLAAAHADHEAGTRLAQQLRQPAQPGTRPFVTPSWRSSRAGSTRPSARSPRHSSWDCRSKARTRSWRSISRCTRSGASRDGWGKS